MKIKVDGHPDLVRDANGAIINTDKDGFFSYINNRKIQQEKEDKINALSEQVASLAALVEEMLQKKGKK